LVANAVHLNSARKDYALVKVSCGASPEGRLESVLFGHEKGAVPEAVRQRRGRLELANKGTLVLDEIDQVPLDLQAKLLRVLQERRFERIGGTDAIDVDVRLVCTTRKDLEREVTAGRFKKEFFDRLNESHIIVPALRQRSDDILPIADSLMQACSAKLHKNQSGFSQTARDLLVRYSFPGNVRELEEVVERAVSRAQEGEELQAWDVCGSLSSSTLSMSLAEAREQFEQDYIVAALTRAEGNTAVASRTLGLSVKTLEEKCAHYHIPLQSTGESEPERS
jgi:transcriptional regulator with GAF, ATPase, and Fis domain